jgi:hypothetical protein
MTDVEAAEKIVRDLTEKRDLTEARIAGIADERKPLAIAVHVDGDHKARKRLDTINAEAATIAAELEGLDAAISEANARLATAVLAEAERADRENAKHLHLLCLELSEHGKRLDGVMSTLRVEAQAFRDTLNAIHARGCNFPSHGLADVNARNAIMTGLMATPWKIEHLAPGERRSFDKIVSGWVSRIEANFISKHLEASPVGETDNEAA